MSKLDKNLRILQILVESAGGSIEPVRHLLRRNHEDMTAEEQSGADLDLEDFIRENLYLR